MAARNIAAAKENRSGEHANITDAFDGSDRQGTMGPGTDPQHRAPAGEGVRAPLAQEAGGDPQFSSFDSTGNERVVVLSEYEKGQPAHGTGPDAASARAGAEKGDSQIGDFGADE